MITNDPNKVIDAILNQKVVAIFQGDSEWGPRALGNRSILFDPRNPDAKTIVNRVKKREPWRPFAATIMLEYAKDYFEMGTLKESPYMTFSIPAKKLAIESVPGIIHVDNTCRIQTVTEQQNYFFYKLIELFYHRTGCPMLFNTSFNLAGEAIVETIDDAIDTVNRSQIELIYHPLLSE